MLGLNDKAHLYFIKHILTLFLMMGGHQTMAQGAHAMDFDHRVTADLPTQKVWDLLKAALEGNQENGFWPTTYSRIYGDVVEGGTLTEIVFGQTQVRYVLSDIVPGTRLTYSPLPGERMVGRSYIELHESPRGGTVIHWYGTYQISPWSAQGVGLRLYECLFFRKLERNLRHLSRLERG